MRKRRYTAEFKKEAAKMIIIDGTPVREVSQQLGVAEGVLYNWKQRHLADLEENAPEGAQSPKAMAEELAQLRKELAKQKRMNEILNKRWASSAIPSDAFPFHRIEQAELSGRRDVRVSGSQPERLLREAEAQHPPEPPTNNSPLAPRGRSPSLSACINQNHNLQHS